MPPIKTPAKPKTPDATAAALVLFAKNLEEVRRWYRGATESGRELPHIVMSELILGHVSQALALALQGVSWEPPAHNP